MRSETGFSSHARTPSSLSVPLPRAAVWAGWERGSAWARGAEEEDGAFTGCWGSSALSIPQLGSGDAHLKKCSLPGPVGLAEGSAEAPVWKRHRDQLCPCPAQGLLVASDMRCHSAQGQGALEIFCKRLVMLTRHVPRGQRSLG